MDQILILEHPLVRLADKICWPRLDAAFASSYRRDIGAPGKVIGLMIGLHYLKLAFNESPERPANATSSARRSRWTR